MFGLLVPRALVSVFTLAILFSPAYPHNLNPGKKARLTGNQAAEEKWVWHFANQKRLEQVHGKNVRAAARNAAAFTDVNDMTILQGDPFTVALQNPFDLNGVSLTFTPSAKSYVVTNGSGTFDPNLGTKLDFATAPAVNPGSTAEPGDDGYLAVDLGFGFSYYGTSYSQVFVTTNGNLVFRPTAMAQHTFDVLAVDSGESLAGLKNELPRIAGYWHDLDGRPVALPGSAGIYLRKDSDRVVVTYNRVPDFENNPGDTGVHRFQMTLFSSGKIVLTYDSAQLTSTALVGISPGPANTDTPTLIDFSKPPAGPLSTAIAEFFTTDNIVDDLTVISDFYDTHSDKYDFVYLMTDFDSSLGDAFAFYSPIRNSIKGIGDKVFDSDSGGTVLGGTKIQGYLNLGNLIGSYPSSPVTRLLAGNSSLSIFGQEQGHRWQAYVHYPDTDQNLILGRDNEHWNFFLNTESTISRPGARRSSSSEGNVWRDNGDGTFTTVSLIDGYSRLDHYLMGLRPPEDVPDTFLITNPTTNRYTRESNPRPGAVTGGTTQPITMANILQANGARDPDYKSAPKSFRVAWILVTMPGKQASDASLNKIMRYRLAWESYFAQATDYLASLNTGLADADGSRVISVSSAAYNSPVLAPGSIGSIFGKGLTDGSTQQTTSTTLPTTLAGTQVMVDGVVAKLFFASPGQINFQVPASTLPSTTAPALDSSTSLVEVMAGGQLVRAGTFQTRASSPALFTADGSGTGPVAALDAFTFQAAPFNAKRANGDANIISVYGTGAGNDGTDVDGNVAASFSATIDGAAARVTYAGRAPGFPGLNQFNVVLPAGIASGDHKLVLSRASIPSNEVVVRIR